MQDFARLGTGPCPCDDRVDPRRFGLRRGFHLHRVVLQTPRDHLGGVTRLNIEQVGEVHGETRLGDAQDEAVREAIDGEAVQRANPVAPLLGQRQPVATDDFETGTPRVFRADLESGREDQAVDAVFGAVHHDAVGSDPLDALALGVDEGDVVAVERLEILVVEARSLAEVAVPRLERLGGGGVGHDRVDSGADLLHLGEVGQIHCAQTFFVRHSFDAVLPHHEELLDDARPRVVDQVLVGVAAGREQLEVLDAATLPAVVQRSVDHAGSVGRLPRTSTVDGVRWKTSSCFTDLARCGTHWIAVAPVPMMPTRLSDSLLRSVPV